MRNAGGDPSQVRQPLGPAEFASQFIQDRDVDIETNIVGRRGTLCILMGSRRLKTFRVVPFAWRKRKTVS
jgi:hypothetical protein